MLSREDLTKHPCFIEKWAVEKNPRRVTYKDLSHRTGGFGGTCERCGTSLQESSNEPARPVEINWEPVVRPKPFNPESLERKIFDLLGETSAPLHREWRTHISSYLAKHLST